MTHIATHTPGPWVLVPLGKNLYIEGKSGQGFVCDMQISDALGEVDSPRIRADANLIAAAPAMYEALHDLVTAHETGMKGSALALRVKIARDALAQADGKQKVS